MHAVKLLSLDILKPHPRNVRTHSKKQIRQIADSIGAYGFTVPVLVDEKFVLLAGHGRLEAAKLLGLKKIPTIVLEGLSEAKKRALLLPITRSPRTPAGIEKGLPWNFLNFPNS